MITDRDVKILVHLLRFRYAFSDQLHQLFFTGRSRQAMHLVTKRLCDRGLISQDYVPRNTGYRLGHLLFLTDKGACVVADAFGKDLETLGYIKVKNKPRSLRFLYHTKRILDFRIALEYRLGQTHLEQKQVLLDSKRSKVKGKWRPETSILGVDGKPIIVPDLIYVLRSARTGNERVLMVEIDCATEALGSVLQNSPSETVMGKVERYMELLTDPKRLWKQSVATTANAFQVLFVTEGKKRVETLLGKCGHIPHPGYVLLSTFERINEAGIFQPVWMVGGKNTRREVSLVS